MALDLSGLAKDQWFAAAAQYAGVPESVVRGQWRVESGNGTAKKNADGIIVSSKGARGDFQVMPEIQATWEQRNGRTYDVRNLQDNLELYASVMKESMQLGKGDITTALRIYQGGTNRRNWGKYNAAYAPDVLNGTGIEVSASSPDVPAASASPVSRAAPYGGVPGAWLGSGNMGDTTWEGGSVSAGWRGDPIGDGTGRLARATKEHIGKLRQGLSELALGDTLAAGGSTEQAVSNLMQVRGNDQIVPWWVQQEVPALERSDMSKAHEALDRANQDNRDEYEFRQSMTWLDKWGAAFDSGLGAAMFNIYDKQRAPNPEGWVYDPTKWETPDMTPDELADIRDNADNLSDLEYTMSRIYTRRYSQRVKSNQGGWSSLGYDLAAGLSDPGNWVVGGLTTLGTTGFRVGGASLLGRVVGETAGSRIAAFGVRGVGGSATEAFAQGQIGKGLGLAVGENVAGSVITDAALVGAGEHRTFGDFVSDAAFATAFGIGFSAMGVRGAWKERDRAVLEMRDADAWATTTQMTEAIRQKAISEVGDSNPVILNNRMRQLETEEINKWIRASMADVPDNMRLFARPDVPEEAPIRAEVQQAVANRYVATGKDGTEFHLRVTEQGPNQPRIIEVVDENGDVLKDSRGFDVGRVIFTDEVRGNNGSIAVRVSPEFQRKGIATAMYRLARDLGGDIGDAQTGEFKGGIKATRSEEGQAFRSNADLDSAKVVPLMQATVDPHARTASTRGMLANSIFKTNRERKKFAKQYGLDTQIGDASTRIQVAEVLGRAERFAHDFQIDTNKLRTILQKGDMEATSTTLMSSASPVARMVSIALLENPEGAAGRHTTAALTRRGLFETYIGSRPRQYEAALRLWRADVLKQGAIKDFLSGWKAREKFDYQVKLYREQRYMGRNVPDAHEAVVQVSHLIDQGYNRMASDQRMVGTVGSNRLPDEYVEGYENRSWLGNLIRNATRDRRESIRLALRDQFGGLGEMYGDKFLNDFSIKYLERIEEKAAGQHRAPTNLFSDDKADTLRDTLRALSMNEEDIAKVMGRYSRGGAKHTKGRIDLDVTKEYTDGEGSFRLMDYLDNRVMDNYRKYASRVAGDVALAKHGIMGDAGIAVLRKAMSVTGATDKELRAFDQVMSEFLGRVVGTGDPTILANARLLTSSVQLGGMGVNQLIEYTNGLPAVGAAGVAEAIRIAPRMRSEIFRLIRGESTGNEILSGFEFISGRGFGLAGYDLHMFSGLDTQAHLSGAERIGLFTAIVQRMVNANRVLSWQRAILAAQQRGFAEVLIAKGVKFLRDGAEADVALKDMGIDDALLARLRRTQDQVVRWGSDGKLEAVDPRNVTELHDRQAWLAFYEAIQRGTNQILQDEFIGETGKWAHNGWLKLLFQHRRFPLVAQQKQLGRYVGLYGAWGTAGIIASAMAVALPLQALRLYSRIALLPESERDEAIEENFSPLAMGKSTLNYISSVGLLNDVLDVGTGVAGGWYEAATGDDAPDWMVKMAGGRLGNRKEQIGGNLAPAIGLMNSAGKAVSGDVRAISDVLPGGRLPYIIPLLKGAAAHYDSTDY